MGHVYAITCLPSTKVYIGKTISQNLPSYVRANYQQAIKGSENKPKLYRAFRKYGPHDFKVVSLLESNDETLLFAWEKYFIKDFMSVEYGYNITEGGQGAGYKHGPDCKHCQWAKTEGAKILKENRHRRVYPEKKVKLKLGWTEEKREEARQRMLDLQSNPDFKEKSRFAGSAERWKGHVKQLPEPKKTPEEIRIGAKQGKGKTSSQFVGVSWESDRQKWLSLIWANGKRHHLGRFQTELEAAAAYDAAAKRLLNIGPINL